MVDKTTAIAENEILGGACTSMNMNANEVIAKLQMTLQSKTYKRSREKWSELREHTELRKKSVQFMELTDLPNLELAVDGTFLSVEEMHQFIAFIRAKRELEGKAP